MIRIAIETQLLNHSKRTGLMTYTEGLIKSLIANDTNNKYSLIYYSLKRKAEDMPGPISSNFNKEVLFFPDLIFPGHEFFKTRFAISSFLKNNKISVYHQPAGYQMPNNKNILKIITVHDLRTITIKDKAWKINSQIYKKTIENCDICTVVSECTKNDLIKHFGIDEKKIKVTYLGADERYKPSSKEMIEKTLKKFDITQPYFLAMGSVPRKNLSRIIKVFSQLKNNDFMLVACCGSDSNTYETLATSLGITNQIKFITEVSDDEIVHLYSGSYCLLFPSLYEGFGLPILEAMHCHCPVITSKTSACPEVAGNAAILVDPENTEEIVSAANEIIKDERMRKDLILKGIEQTKKFSWDNFARQMLDIYQKG